LNQPGVKL